jgi:hypothetical protein
MPAHFHIKWKWNEIARIYHWKLQCSELGSLRSFTKPRRTLTFLWWVTWLTSMRDKPAREKQWEISERDLYFIIIKVIIKILLFCYRELPWILLREARIQDRGDRWLQLHGRSYWGDSQKRPVQALAKVYVPTVGYIPPLRGKTETQCPKPNEFWITE